jgi:hypothetical protein
VSGREVKVMLKDIEVHFAPAEYRNITQQRHNRRHSHMHSFSRVEELLECCGWKIYYIQRKHRFVFRTSS